MQQPQPVPFPTIFSIDAKGHDNFFVFSTGAAFAVRGHFLVIWSQE